MYIHIAIHIAIYMYIHGAVHIAYYVYVHIAYYMYMYGAIHIAIHIANYVYVHIAVHVCIQHKRRNASNVHTRQYMYKGQSAKRHRLRGKEYVQAIVHFYWAARQNGLVACLMSGINALCSTMHVVHASMSA